MPESTPIGFGAAFRTAAERIGFTILAMDLDSALVAHQDRTLTVDLRNIRDYLTRTDESRQEKVLARYIVALLHTDTMPASYSLQEVLDRLLPRVGSPFPAGRTNPPSRSLVPGSLEVFLVVDESDTLWYVNQHDLDEWSTGFAVLLETALANLRSRSSRRAWRVEASDPNVLAYAGADSYDSSRILLLKELFDPWPVSGIVAAVPARDVLTCIKFDETKILDAVCHLSELTYRTYRRSPCKLSDQLYWFDGELWEQIGIHRSGNSTNVFPSTRLANLIGHVSSS